MTSVLRRRRRSFAHRVNGNPEPHSDVGATRESRIANDGGAPKREHNGFANYETWAVSLWINNDYESYRMYRTLARDVVACTPTAFASGLTTQDVLTNALAEAIRGEFEDGCPVLVEPTVHADLLAAALNEVDWHELAEELLNDISQENHE